jgi:hypothetical protein
MSKYLYLGRSLHTLGQACLPRQRPFVGQDQFGEGAELCTRGACAPQTRSFTAYRAVVSSKSPPRFLADSMLMMKLCNFLH